MIRDWCLCYSSMIVTHDYPHLYVLLFSKWGGQAGEKGSGGKGGKSGRGKAGRAERFINTNRSDPHFEPPQLPPFSTRSAGGEQFPEGRCDPRLQGLF